MKANAHLGRRGILKEVCENHRLGVVEIVVWGMSAIHCISGNDSQFIRPGSRLEGILSGDILNLRSKRREIDSLLTVGYPRKMLKPFITLLTVHIEEDMLHFRFGEEY